MKRLVTIFLFIKIGMISILAQQRDSLEIIIHDEEVKLIDSLLPIKRNLEIDPSIPDYMQSDMFPPIVTKNQMNFSLGKPLNRKSLFHSSYSRYIVPTVLISYGMLTRKREWLQELDHSTHHEVSEHLNTKIPVDDYSQFLPALAVYGLDFAGIKAKHNLRDRTIVMGTSHIIMFGTVHALKRATHVERPDGSNTQSFPSGHTAMAFTGAHILFREYKEASPWIGIAGYAVATTTGTLRVLNKKHWVSDIVTGAGIGILSAEVGYLLLPLFRQIPGIKKKEQSLVVAPTIGKDNYGFGLAYTF